MSEIDQHQTSSTGWPLTFTSSTELVTLAVRCGPTQHDYWQGIDTDGREGDELRKLLFCRQCGDVITLALPSQDKGDNA